MEKIQDIKSIGAAPESIDTEKLSAVFRKNLIWVILIFITTNLAAYLTLRYTKDLFESETQLKLDIKRDATEMGIKTIMADDENLNIVSGEIEQIKSRLFLNKLVDSLDLSISYFSIGKVLKDEMYRRSPFEVTAYKINPAHQDKPFHFDFAEGNKFRIRTDENGGNIEGSFNVPLTIDGTLISISKTKYFTEDDDNDYHFVLNSRQSLIDYLEQNLQVEPLNYNANTIRISFRDYNALKAYVVVSKMDSLYITYSNEQKNLANTQKIDWLNRELSQVEKRMEGFEDYFETFTLQNKSSDLTLDLKRTIAAINKVDSQRYELNKKLIELNTILGFVSANQFASITPPYKGMPESVNIHLEELLKATQGKEKLSLAYKDNTYAYKRKELELSTSRDQLFKKLTEIKKEWLSSMTEFGKRKEGLEREFASMPDKNTQFSKNQRFYKLYEEFYLSMMQSKAEFEIAQAGSTPDFKILSPATIPTIPISPKKFMIIGIGLVAGLVLNFFFIGLLYVLNNKITSVKEIEKNVSIPLLGAIPVTNHVTESIFHVIDNPKSVVSEAIRTLRTNLDFFISGGSNKIITISSTISGEGKSFLAVNLGGVLALSRKRVLLVDLDMRKPKGQKYPAGNDPTRGMSTVLIKKNKWQDCIVKTSLENFDFLPSGPHPPNPSELLLNGEFSEFLDEVRKAYDFIVIDTPPVGLVTDGIMAMKRSDLSIYVFRANYSSKDFLANLKRLIALNKISSISAVLNAMPLTTKNYGYGYYEDRTKVKKGWRKFFPG